ncbi:ABC transporter permease subunit, partial [Clavibacter michiganensis]
REDEDAVRALGKNVYSYKMQALVLGGVFGGLAGFVLCGAGVAAVLVTEARRAGAVRDENSSSAADHPTPGADRREPAARAA